MVDAGCRSSARDRIARVRRHEFIFECPKTGRQHQGIAVDYCASTHRALSHACDLQFLAGRSSGIITNKFPLSPLPHGGEEGEGAKAKNNVGFSYYNPPVFRGYPVRG